MIVADTNLLAYLLIAGPFSAAAQRAFERDSDWVVPGVWQYELLNVLATSVRAGHLPHAKALEVWARAPAFVREVAVSAIDALALAAATNFATFDCYYVVLAEALGARLVTADRKLLARFANVAVGIDQFADGK